jgi:UDP-N-acetylmuramoylalanine--D-glutamate ligase
VRRVGAAPGETRGVSASDPRPPVPAGPYLVVGLARSGQAVARLLAERGEEVLGVDAGAPAGAAGLRQVGVEVRLDGQGIELLDRVRCLVKSPGVPREAPVVANALRRGHTVIGELELAWRLLANRFVAVTGTNGKTTVTELLGHVWRTAGRPVAVAGNVGTPLASLVGRISEDATVICECSSFQLEDAEAFAPECGVILNVTPDHLDRHGSLDAYLAAKLRIFANQGNDDFAVVNGSDKALRGRDLGGCGRRIGFCRDGGADCEIQLAQGTIFAAGEPLLAASELELIGAHNVENAMAAAGAALAMGIEREAVAAGLRTFPGVGHRLEPVAEIGGVAYVNDSKATNVSAARAALEAFPGGIHAILGGSSKGESFAELTETVADRCAACYLVGETAPALERDLAAAWESGVEHRHFTGLPDAVRAAAAAATAGEVVLLAPACASFDAYRDYEERGEHFRSLVRALEPGGPR